MPGRSRPRRFGVRRSTLAPTPLRTPTPLWPPTPLRAPTPFWPPAPLRARARRGTPTLGWRVGLLFVALLAIVAPRHAEAQLTPADSAAVLLQAADAFAQEGRWEIAEAIYERITERFGGTPAAETARARLRASASDRPQRMSRVELQVFGATYGAWLGVAVPLALGSNEPEAYGAGLLVGAPLGILASRAYMNRHPVSEGQARAISWGGIWGTWQGFGWAEVLDIGEGQFCDDFGCYDTDDNGEELVAAMVIGGLAGITTGGLLARNPIRSGVASGAQGGSTWGTIYGLMITGIVDEDVNDDGLLLATLLAGNGGLVAGAALAHSYDLSRGDIRMINLGALVGGLAGLGLDLLIQPDDTEVALGIPLVTSLVGLGIAASRTSGDGASEAGEVPDMDLALLDYRDGTLTVNTPLPQPTLLPMERPNARTEWKPGLTVELFRARF